MTEDQRGRSTLALGPNPAKPDSVKARRVLDEPPLESLEGVPMAIAFDSLRT